jgi:hypothetical protein
MKNWPGEPKLPRMPSSPSAGSGWASCSTTPWRATWARFRPWPNGPQLLPGFAARLRSGWGVWLLPDPARTRLVREERLAKEDTLAGRPATGCARAHRLLQRDALLTERIRQSAALSGRPVIEVSALPDWSAIAAGVESALAPALRSAPHLSPGSELSRQRRYENHVPVRV